MKKEVTEDLKKRLPALMPKAIAWVEEQSDFILKNGEPLSSLELEIAKKVGVRHPELVRVLEVESLPLPEDVELKEAASSINFLSSTMIGMAFGYGIYICHNNRDIRLMSHELRHVFQYEEAGGIKKYIPTYLDQLILFGYRDAPLEIDARKSEIN